MYWLYFKTYVELQQNGEMKLLMKRRDFYLSNEIIALQTANNMPCKKKPVSKVQKSIISFCIVK